jgi:hypothetical protein
MTLASWLYSLRHSGRLTRTVAHPDRRLRASRRRASYDALEGRLLLSSTVNFDAASETVNVSTGTFSIPGVFHAARRRRFSEVGRSRNQPRQRGVTKTKGARLRN